MTGFILRPQDPETLRNERKNAATRPQPCQSFSRQKQLAHEGCSQMSDIDCLIRFDIYRRDGARAMRAERAR